MAKMKKKTRRLLLNLAFVVVLITVTLVVLFVSQKDELNFRDIMEYFKNSNPVWIVAAFVCMLFFEMFEGFSLYVLARFFGHRSRLVSSMSYSFADTFYSVITPSATGGQPAIVYYMARDGVSAGKASFAVLFNVICYTASIFVIGVAALCINPSMFGAINTVFAKVLVIVGAVIQFVLLGFFIGCMFFGKAIIKIGNGLVSFLNKIKIIKNPDKWRNKISEEVAKYSACRHILKDKPAIIFTTLLFNILQRVSQTLIPCFVCLAIDPQAPFLEIFVLQALVLFGYNSVPIPGGVGAYEYLFINVYSQLYDSGFIMLALMISRLISYYICMILSGVVTLTYHMATVKKLPESAVVKDGDSPTESEQNTDTAVAEISEETGGEKKEMPEEKENTEENKENYDTEHTP